MEARMNIAWNITGRFVRQADGQDLIEYALLAAFIALAAAAATGLVGIELNNWYTAVSASIALLPTSL
jgi:Flp pilus assembly pilin Flp